MTNTDLLARIDRALRGPTGAGELFALVRLLRRMVAEKQLRLEI